MKQRQNIDYKLPIFGWLFFLFLSSGISYNQNNLQFRKPVLIERIDQVISKLWKRKGVAAFSVGSEKSNTYQRLDSQFFRINLLLIKLNNSIHIILNRQSALFRLILQNIISHFRSRSLASNSSDDFPDFIS